MGPRLVARGYEVVGLDTVCYGEGCAFVPDQETIPTTQKDIRDLTADDLSGFDTVVHLAALSNDPLGNLKDEWTYEST